MASTSAKPLKTYDPRDVIVLLNGIPIGGFADGTFININRNVETFGYLTGVDGEFVRFKRADKSGLITLTLNQSSDSNSILQSQHELDLISNTGAFGIFISYKFTGATYTSSNAFVVSHPDADLSKEATTREWKILCDPLEIREVGLGLGF